MVLNTSIDLLSILSAVSATIGALFLVRSILVSGAKEIASMSGTYLGSNPHLEQSLVNQKADTVMGFSLTFVGGIFAACSAIISITFEPNVISIVLFSIITVFFYFVCNQVSKLIRKKLGIKVSAISFTNHVAGYLRSPNLFDAHRLVEDAKKYGLQEFINTSKDDYENLAGILRFAGANPGADEILKLRSTLKKP